MFNKSQCRNDVGCWFDSARGIHIGEEVIKLAVEYGFDPEERVEDITPDHEFYYEIQENAEEYLNSLLPDGFHFGSNQSGDWGLWEDNDDVA